VKQITGSGERGDGGDEEVRSRSWSLVLTSRREGKGKEEP
jgi:hypothetical protein